MMTFMRTRLGGQRGTSECLKALFTQDYLDDMSMDRTAPFRGDGDGRQPSNELTATDSLFRRTFITNFCQLQRSMTIRSVKSCIKNYLLKRKDHLAYLRLLESLTRLGYAGRDQILTGVNALRDMLGTLKMSPKQNGAQAAIIENIRRINSNNNTNPPAVLGARPNSNTAPTTPNPARR